jgi:hypothetical protein
MEHITTDQWKVFTANIDVSENDMEDVCDYLRMMASYQACEENTFLIFVCGSLSHIRSLKNGIKDIDTDILPRINSWGSSNS